VAWSWPRAAVPSGLAARGRDEMLATEARPRRIALSGVESLTPSERRVAQLAADGLTNRAIAQERFFTENTVERHLAHAFDSWGCARAHNCPTHRARRAPPPHRRGQLSTTSGCRAASRLVLAAP
jgi:DNA-binding NarL/FixJ family response regulator